MLIDQVELQNLFWSLHPPRGQVSALPYGSQFTSRGSSDDHVGELLAPDRLAQV